MILSLAYWRVTDVNYDDPVQDAEGSGLGFGTRVLWGDS